MLTTQIKDIKLYLKQNGIEQRVEQMTSDMKKLDRKISQSVSQVQLDMEA